MFLLLIFGLVIETSLAAQLLAIERTNGGSSNSAWIVTLEQNPEDDTCNTAEDSNPECPQYQSCDVVADCLGGETSCEGGFCRVGCTVDADCPFFAPSCSSGLCTPDPPCDQRRRICQIFDSSVDAATNILGRFKPFNGGSDKYGGITYRKETDDEYVYWSALCTLRDETLCGVPNDDLIIVRTNLATCVTEAAVQSPASILKIEAVATWEEKSYMFYLGQIVATGASGDPRTVAYSEYIEADFTFEEAKELCDCEDCEEKKLQGSGIEVGPMDNGICFYSCL